MPGQLTGDEPKTEDKIQAMGNNTTLKPARDNGVISISHEPYDLNQPASGLELQPLDPPRALAARL